MFDRQLIRELERRSSGIPKETFIAAIESQVRRGLLPTTRLDPLINMSPRQRRVIIGDIYAARAIIPTYDPSSNGVLRLSDNGLDSSDTRRY